MATSRVELVFSGDDSKAMAAAAKLLDAARATGDAWEGAGKRQKGALDSVLPAVQNFLGVSLSIGGALKLVNDYFDSMKQKAEAVRQEMERVGQRTSGYSEAFGRLMMNMPGASSAELQQVDTVIRQQAGSRAIGTGGMARLADAMAMIQSSVPTASMGNKLDVIREVAQTLELEPTADASGVGLGIAKVMEGSGFKLSGNQAQNLLRNQQMLGMVTQVGQVSRMIPALSVAATESGMDMPGMMGMAAWATQVLGDTEGSETGTVLGSLAQKLVKNEGDIEKKVRGLDLSGNLMDRMRQVAAARADGRLKDADLMDIFPKMGARGVSGMTLLSAAMDPTRAGMLEDFVGRMRSPSVLEGDMMADSITAKRGILSFGEDMATRQAMGQIETESVTRGPLAQLQGETARLRARMQADMASEGQQIYAEQRYISGRVTRMQGGSPSTFGAPFIAPSVRGMSEEEATAYARRAEDSNWFSRRGASASAALDSYQALIDLKEGTGTIDGKALERAVRNGVVDGSRAARAEGGSPHVELESH